MATEGDVRVASLIKAARADLDDIGFFTSGSWIRQAQDKLKNLPVDTKLLMTAGPKRSVVLEKEIAAYAHFSQNWKEGSGSSAYLIAPDTIKIIDQIITILDLPESVVSSTYTVPPVEPMGNVPTPPPPAAATQPAQTPPSEAPPAKDSPSSKEKEEEKGFFAKIPWYGWAAGAAALALLTGVAAAAGLRGK